MYRFVTLISYRFKLCLNVSLWELAYGAMAFCAAPYMFWSLFGSQLVRATIHQGITMSL
jgi:hypothetical protein